MKIVFPNDKDTQNQLEEWVETKSNKFYVFALIDGTLEQQSIALDTEKEAMDFAIGSKQRRSDMNYMIVEEKCYL